MSLIGDLFNGDNKEQLFGDLYQAIIAQDVNKVKTLISKISTIDDVSKDRQRPLLTAIDKKNVEITEIMLKGGANPNPTMANPSPGEFPLACAACLESSEIVRKLIDAGADPNFIPKGSHDQTALMRAAGESTEEIVKLLLGAGAKAVLLEANDTKSAVQYALYKEHAMLNDKALRRIDDLAMRSRIVDLLRLKADEELRSMQVTLNQAVRHGATEKVRELLKSNIPINETDTEGRTALSYAAEFAFIDIVDLLLENGASATEYLHVEKKTEYNPLARTDAHPAVVYAAGGMCTPHSSTHVPGGDDKQFLIVKKLLEKGVDPNVCNSVDGRTALMMAARAGNVKVAKLLCDNGADIRKRCMKNYSAKDCAQAGSKMAKMLAELSGIPDIFPDLKKEIKTFKKSSENASFKEVVAEISKVCGQESKSLKKYAGVMRFLFELTNESNSTFMQMHEKALNAGFVLVYCKDQEKAPLLVFPTDNKLAVVLALDCSAAGQETAESLVEALFEIDRISPFVLTQCADDLIAGYFIKPVKNPNQIAEKMFKLCGDIGDGSATAEDLAKELGAKGELYLWWD